MRSSATLLRLFRTSSGHLPRARNISKAPSPFNAYRPLPLSSRAGSLYAYNSRRYNSSSSDAADINPRPLTDRVPNASVDAANAEQNAARRAEEPAYRIVFTCKPCGERSDHQMSKHGYHKGTVLITCPSCHARHIISDHLGIFMDEKSSLEDILGTKGMKVTKGVLNDDLEIWEDGSVYKAGSNKEGVDISSDVSPKETP
ncbi:hypothetical protein TMatcc_005554 [Talaromyces marneffei ATCC 18224]|uniref:Mitochondrial import protein Zim17, putative n=1 Tax=Talaromyces marneffei (strain ATCC 18224 / CBS 334.59 / QM 7333) TaxID=441960 RepID=B6QA30_TALMQ|nr:uncharacterized protein EYB26_005915 [Talaromyces marneffei]EEA26194.1 mitochondrial import protein Zim17, putative [Talaromyces marneffei ATCC 18224]KAE8554891.1 hypothetical protein EYB25_003438 [Talaromyces marneffei]QGA18231.1 hypothetical protein EYB26_005915 [Talaromyces marneffei]